MMTKTRLSGNTLRLQGGKPLVLLSLLLIAACSRNDGPARYHLSGTVTLNGKPVPAGSVSFVPDTKKGNSGPGGSAPIKNGRFDTREEGIGHVGGPHIVSVTGLDGVPTPDFPRGIPVFSGYRVSVDLPKLDGVQNIDVPASIAGKP